jgi:hypothetical protein
VGPARMIAESLTPKPGIREQYLPTADWPVQQRLFDHFVGARG